ncbi:MAG TPA: hypothetical protein VGD60_10055 [Candidatus Acidoferrales bacterium]
MAIGNPAVAARIAKPAGATNPFRAFLARYFYFAMSLVFAVVVVWGFSRTVDASLFHGNPPRPLLLWFHGAAFSAWVVFFIAQSALVRARNIKLHRTLGWFGAGLAATMVILGCVVAVVMARFDGVVLHQKDTDAFLAIPFLDMLSFGACMAFAIYWRKKPEYHRRLIFIATCALMDAPIARFDFIFDHNLFYVALDLLIALGIARDLIVDKRIHQVYRYALLALIPAQMVAVYLWRANPAWYQSITRAILS